MYLILQKKSWNLKNKSTWCHPDLPWESEEGHGVNRDQEVNGTQTVSQQADKQENGMTTEQTNGDITETERIMGNTVLDNIPEATEVKWD